MVVAALVEMSWLTIEVIKNHSGLVGYLRLQGPILCITDANRTSAAIKWVKAVLSCRCHWAGVWTRFGDLEMKNPPV